MGCCVWLCHVAGLARACLQLAYATMCHTNGVGASTGEHVGCCCAHAVRCRRVCKGACPPARRVCPIVELGLFVAEMCLHVHITGSCSPFHPPSRHMCAFASTHAVKMSSPLPFRHVCAFAGRGSSRRPAGGAPGGVHRGCCRQQAAGVSSGLLSHRWVTGAAVSCRCCACCAHRRQSRLCPCCCTPAPFLKRLTISSPCPAGCRCSRVPGRQHTHDHDDHGAYWGSPAQLQAGRLTRHPVTSCLPVHRAAPVRVLRLSPYHDVAHAIFSVCCRSW